MSLELINTLGTVTTVIIVAAAAIAALIQLRHLRASNQLAALLTLMEQWNDPSWQSVYKIVRVDVAGQSRDPAYLADFAQPVDRSKHPEILVCDFWEQIGTFAKYHLVDPNVLLDSTGSQITISWEIMQPAIEVMRRRNLSSYENFEYIAVLATLFNRRYPVGAYPRGFPRMKDVQSE